MTIIACGNATCSDDSDNCNQGFYDVHHFQDDDDSRSPSLIMLIMLMIMMMIIIMMMTTIITKINIRMRMTQGLHHWPAQLCATLCLTRFLIMIIQVDDEYYNHDQR